jgi:hypothetical protein
MRAGLPDGRALANRLAKLSACGDDDDLIALCDRIEGHHGRAFLRRQLVQVLDDECVPLSDAHQLLARISFASYVTTNVDRLMEWALRDAERRPGPIFLETDPELLRLNRVPVIKLHGDLDHPFTLVFSTDDFAQFETRKPGFQRLLWQALSDHSLVIVGYRGTDPNFVSTLRLIQKHGSGAEHLLIDFGRESDREQLLELGCYLIDPGPGQYDRLPQILGWDAVFDACLDLLDAEPRVDLLELFRGPAAETVSASGWWRLYYRRLLRLTSQGDIDLDAVAERVRDGLGRAERADPAQLIGLAQALLDEPPLGDDVNDVIQRCIHALSLRRRLSGFELILPLCEHYLEWIYPAARLMRRSAGWGRAGQRGAPDGSAVGGVPGRRGPAGRGPDRAAAR